MNCALLGVEEKLPPHKYRLQEIFVHTWPRRTREAVDALVEELSTAYLSAAYKDLLNGTPRKRKGERSETWHGMAVGPVVSEEKRRSQRILKNAVSEVVKVALKPSYKAGTIDKEP